MKLFISPSYKGRDLGNHGGIRRVIDAQVDFFKEDIVERVEDADTVAIHAGSMVKVRSDQRIIAHCHGFLWNKYNWEPINADPINKAVVDVIRLSDDVTAPTQWVSNVIKRGMCRSVTVIPHGVDEDWVPGTINDEYVLWNKSRIDSVCNPMPVYEVAKLLPEIKFKMTVGQSKASNIEITGLTPYDDKSPVQCAGVYLATTQETFGIGTLEALACGVPVVGWDWGGQSEILPKNWLAREGDYQTLAKLIEWAILNRANLKEQCLEIASKYTWQSAMEKYEQLYYEPFGYPKRVSVIIRNYNLASYLPDCVQSIRPQLTEEDELFVVDDCSTDNSLEVCEALDVQVEQPPENLHLAGALNYAMDKAKGRYILHIDADNVLEPNTIKTLATALDKDRKIDIAYGNVRWLKEDGTEAKTKSNWPPSRFVLSRQLTHMNQIPCTSMYRRKVFDVAGPYRFRCRVAEDADFWCRATSLGFVPQYITEAYTLGYRIRNSTSANTPEWPWEKWYDWRGGQPFAAVGSIAPNVFSYEPTLVSVIIPVGSGHEKFLEDAVDSLYMQTFKNWECIIINDTGHMLNYVPVWAKYLETDGEQGPAYCRNLAIEQSKGSLIVPLDADDHFLGATALEDMLKLWRQNQHCYVYTDYMHDNVVQNCKEPVCGILKEKMPHIITGLYPKLPDVRFKDIIMEDWDFALQMTNAGYCGVRLRKPVVFYRTTSGNRRKIATIDDRDAIINEWKDVEFMCFCKDKPRFANMIGDFEGQDTVIIKFIGNDSKRWFVGRNSGRQYSFGASNREKPVLRIDLDGFKDRPTQFLIPS